MYLVSLIPQETHYMRQTDKKHPDSFYCMISQNVVNQNMQMPSISSYTYKKKKKKKKKKKGV